jgi:hypothetical protein
MLKFYLFPPATAILLSLCVFLWSPIVSAHKEQTHGAASILAFEYLEWRSIQEEGGSQRLQWS